MTDAPAQFVTTSSAPKPVTDASADALTSDTLDPAFRRLHTVVRLACVQPANAASLPAPRSVLLIAPPGTGKTTFVRLLSSHHRLPLHHVPPTALSPASLLAAFDAARRQQPALLCMDDVDLLLPHTSDDEAWQATLLSTFLAQLAALSASTDRVLLVLLCSTAGVTRLARAVQSAVEVTLEASLPTAAHRLSILQHMLAPLCAPQPAADSFSFLPAVVAECGGMSGSDLSAVVREAAQHALSTDSHTLTHSDFLAALQLVSASSAGAAVKVDTEARVGWSDIVGMDDIKQQLQEYLIPLLRHSSAPSTSGLAAPTLAASLRSPAGVLLYGPPGTGKTLLAQALSSVPGVSFLSLSLSSLLHSHVGESERALLAAFQRALSVAPAVLFIDELDALFSATTAVSTTSRLTSTLCSLLDAVHSQRLPVLLLAASNVPQLLEPRLLMASRFGACLHVGLPSAAERLTMARRLISDARVECEAGAQAAVEECTDGFTMADVRFLMGLCLRGREGGTVAAADVREARSRMSGSVSADMARTLQRWEASRRGQVRKRAERLDATAG